MKEFKRGLAIYIHIPFCARKCSYCDFLSFPGTEDMQGAYAQRLLWEIYENAKDYSEFEVQTVFIGGGTPTTIRAEYIEYMMDVVVKHFNFRGDAECTIECNPGTADMDKLKRYRECGINRISIGCQSVRDRELKLLGRIHNREQFLECFRMARAAGFENINVDLMSGLPGQSVADWEENLHTVAELAPEHISAYSLIIEEGTPFYGKYHRQLELREKGLEPEEIRKKLEKEDTTAAEERALLPSEDAEREMYHKTTEILAQYGYQQYELSNYAKPGRECRHNLVYWQRRDYAGFGLGAASCVGEVRWKNVTDLRTYLDCDRVTTLQTEREALSAEAQRSEAMFLGLRLTDGIDIKEFADRYGRFPEYFYVDWIGKMKQEGLLEEMEGRLRLTETGWDLANIVMAGFV